MPILSNGTSVGACSYRSLAEATAPLAMDFAGARRAEASVTCAMSTPKAQSIGRFSSCALSAAERGSSMRRKTNRDSGD